MSEDVYSIKEVRGFEILDSRGNFTVRVCVSTGFLTECGDAPAGASRGSYEAFELVDSGPIKRTSKAAYMANTLLAQALVGLDVRNQHKVDSLMRELDGTQNFSKIGGNTAIATSIAVAKLAASTLGLEYFEYIGGLREKRIPVPLFNVINGGLHGAGFLDFQEFLIIPVGFRSFKEALVESVAVFHHLKNSIRKAYGRVAVMAGDEGGLSPPVRLAMEALELIATSVEASGYTLGKEFFLGIDAAASGLYNASDGRYKADGRIFTPEELEDHYTALSTTYKLIYLEDPFTESDFDSFARLRKRLSGVIVTGDDLYATNVMRLREGCRRGSTSGAIVKPNQIGTLTETINFIDEARLCGNQIIVSHRSGDTEDYFIADLAVGVSSEFIKTGAPARGERTSKLNRLLMLEEKYGLTYSSDRMLRL